MLRRNVGDLERLLRVILGIYAMLLGFLFISGLAGNLLGFIGLLVFVTGAVGWCGIYTLMGRELPQAAVSEPGQAPEETGIEASSLDEAEIVSSVSVVDEADLASAQPALSDPSLVELIEPEPADESQSA
ncbi:MAG: DUF2892 domain-containing protein [Anaerolineae bacterium]|jgi:hypothetical protein|nr:DUF2892 domain-containing protein [Anaerolineae bacterium]